MQVTVRVMVQNHLNMVNVYPFCCNIALALHPAFTLVVTDESFVSDLTTFVNLHIMNYETPLRPLRMLDHGYREGGSEKTGG